ncbi:MAG: tail fiber domain-containing protein [Candidatus Udaeobacter sp.]
MNVPIQLRTTTPPLLIPLLLACFAFLPGALAVIPAPDGGYPGFTTAEGSNALQNLTTGVGNTATGWRSLFTNSAGNLNTAIGAGTLLLNTGDNNTATGALALLSNTTGEDNTATGAFALLSNTEGRDNTADGYQALYSNTSGANNAALGFQTLFNNTDGYSNTAIGFEALVSNTGGRFNIALGSYAGLNLTTEDSNIDIDNEGVAGDVGTIRIGQNMFHHATYLAGIAGQTVGAGGSTCFVDNDGKLGVFLSARRYKENIHCMDAASTALFSLKPVTFRYKPEFDKSGTPQFGLIAEEVAQVSPDLVIHDAKGQLSTVRYEAVNAMLLNEFLKEHRKVQELEAKIARQQDNFEEAGAKQRAQIQVLTARLDEQDEKLEATVATLAAQLQKVTAQVEMNHSAAQVVVSNQ